jgi:Tfp pilus assembly protein FimT
MFLVKLVLVTAAVVQMAAAAVALRLVRLTGRRWAWGLLASAILLMVARRGVPLYRIFTGDPSFSSDLAFELMGLVISLALLAGLIGMWPVFVALRKSRDTLRWQGRRLKALLQLARMADAPVQQMVDFALREAVRLTHSERGHLVLLDEDQSPGINTIGRKPRRILVQEATSQRILAGSDNLMAASPAAASASHCARSGQRSGESVDPVGAAATCVACACIRWTSGSWRLPASWANGSRMTNPTRSIWPY